MEVILLYMLGQILPANSIHYAFIDLSHIATELWVHYAFFLIQKFYYELLHLYSYLCFAAKLCLCIFVACVLGS